MSFLRVALIGRPNVGKSTFFNRLCGKQLAIVHDEPGVTRDLKEHRGRLGDLSLLVIDTAGLESQSDDPLMEDFWSVGERALERADVALFMVDGREGITPVDHELGRWLRKKGVPVIVVANKCEGSKSQEGYLEAFSLGFDTPLPLSAAHGEGLMELYETLLPFSYEQEEDDTPHHLNLAIVGRPNVGKSTLVNTLLGEERMLTGDFAGLTRDSIHTDWSYGGRAIRLVDTAGLRQKTKIASDLEKRAVQDSLRSIQYADVVALVIDSEAPLEKQDITIASRVIDEGRSLVIALNKWDKIREPKALLEEIQYKLSLHLSSVKGVVYVPLSALSGRNIDRLMEAVLAADALRNRRVSTPQLNQWLREAVAQHPPPLLGGRRPKIKYITQIKVRPPTFVLFGNRTKDLPESYLRYLSNSLREVFNLPGVPLRLYCREPQNPFDR